MATFATTRRHPIGIMADLPDPTTKQRKTTGQARLLKAARDMLAEQPPSNISSRRLAKRAGVHHTLANYTHGGITDLLAAAYRFEKTQFNETMDADLFRPSATFPLANRPTYWRAYVYLTLDSYKPALEKELVSDHSARHYASVIRNRFPHLSNATISALAAAWWSLQIGGLVFDKPFSQGLSISLRQRDLVRELAAARLSNLVSAPPDDLPQQTVPDFSDAGPATVTTARNGREAVERRLVEAAVELLKERADIGVSGRELAKRAKVNYGLIHHYFGSKDGVFDKAFVHLNELYVHSRVVGEDERLAEPFSMISHESFLRNWAFRELAGIAMPQINLKGQRLLLDALCRRHGLEQRSGRGFAEVQADAYCSIALQLGWVLCRRNLLTVLECDEAELVGRMTGIVKWIVARRWP